MRLLSYLRARTMVIPMSIITTPVPMRIQVTTSVNKNITSSILIIDDFNYFDLFIFMFLFLT